MWDLFDESDDDALSQLWGLFRPDGDLSWQHKALCAQTDPEAFFPEKGGSTRDAKRICAQCEVREQCLQWAIDHDERFGIWGGMSERERRRYKKAQAGRTA
ncbi:WhiB family transcriptional regulator [Bifidobacterium vespertilionis]|uniref:Transcriptional regulator WhiB n=1 Tax=Bifidobacterium vespertilionis TaxID=2562524 RepID=A0A5J5DXJ8_9BIFI|nr:WhiB family transcriptional regulator [Bifidobacterium vespertilionis]KAA8821647.1 WhiB family transcriptional regulator [Bifidobacterium vespertilionis]KAA8824727.1 WhiB family transcriptional regulator [Bifidobacterium vespertilionis]MBT1178305.1 WhiB family transcriptional regulator [Bifidobacterium vespertilionis]